MAVTHNKYPENGVLVIYFLQGKLTNKIKIGFTADTNPRRRLSCCKTYNPDKLVLLGVMAGTIEDEQALHERFGQHHVQGEWFRPHEELLAFIKDNATAWVPSRVRPTGKATKPETLRRKQRAERNERVGLLALNLVARFAGRAA